MCLLTPHGYLLDVSRSLWRAGRRFAASSCGSCFHFILEFKVRSVGNTATHADDILGCGEGSALKLQEKYAPEASGEVLHPCGYGAYPREGSPPHCYPEVRGQAGIDANLSRIARCAATADLG